MINNKLSKSNKHKQNNIDNICIKDKANYINTYFSNIGKNLSKKIGTWVNNKINTPIVNNNTIFMKPTNRFEIENNLNDLKN